MTWVYNPQHETKVSDLDAISRWPTIVGVCVSLTILMTITVGLRIYVRARMIKSLGIDDYVMIFSMVSLLSDLSILNQLTLIRYVASYIIAFA